MSDFNVPGSRPNKNTMKFRKSSVLESRRLAGGAHRAHHRGEWGSGAARRTGERRLHVCMSAWLHVCMSACLHVCMAACLHVCMSACLHVCMSVCLCVCVFVSVCLSVSLSLSLYGAGDDKQQAKPPQQLSAMIDASLNMLLVYVSLLLNFIICLLFIYCLISCCLLFIDASAKAACSSPC